MKSIVKTFLILFLCTFTFTNTHKSRKGQTVYQFYNTLSNSKNQENSELSTNTENNEVNKLKTKFKKNKKSHAKHHKKNSILADIEAKENLGENENSFLAKKEKESEPEKYIYTGWQQVSSKLFQNPNIFPRLKVPNASGRIVDEGIKVDKDDYRINSKKNPAPQTDKEFYFRMSDERILYTTDATDINFLQIFYFRDYNKVEEKPIKFLPDRTSISCFDMIQKMTKFRYSFCSKDRKENLKFMCAIGKKLNVLLDSCIKDDPKENGIENNTVIKKTIIDATIVIPQPSKNCNEKWNYDNHGDDWECLCKQGDSQSPIDLPDLDDSSLIYSPITPLFQFEEVPAKVPVTTVEGEYIEDGNIKIKYLNGAIRVLHPNLGKAVTLNGSVYIAEEISVHTPSEHTRDGKRLDMEIQIIFYGVSKGDIAKQVVLSFLFEKKPGYYNRFVDDLDFYSLPNAKDTEKFILNDLFIPKIFYSVTGGEDKNDEFTTMKPFSFYTYEGSLTFPPCSESTIHYVASETLPIGSVVLDLAMEALRMPDMKRDDSNGQSTTIRDNSVVENYRNIQDRNHRRVFYFDHKRYMSPNLDVQNESSRQEGNHYERVKRNVYYHIFVPGMHPSGIPGSYLESKDEALGIKKEEKKKN